MKLGRPLYYILLQAILTLICVESIGQPSPKIQTLLKEKIGFENFNASDGLSQNSCYAITQDHKGFLWLGTQDGLNRFDGIRFNTIRPSEVLTVPKLSNHITALSYDEIRNLIWIGTQSGLCLFDLKTNRLLTLSEKFDLNHPFVTKSINKIIIDASHQIWILIDKTDVVKIDFTNDDPLIKTTKSSNKTNLEEIALFQNNILIGGGNQIYSLVENGSRLTTQLLIDTTEIVDIKSMIEYNDRLWVGTISSGCFVFDSIHDHTSFHQFEPLKEAGVGSFIIDHLNKLWIGTRGKGIIVYNEELNTIKKASFNPSIQNSISRNFVLSMFADKQGIIWIGMSGSGFDKYDPLRFQFHNINQDLINNDNLKDHMVFTIYKTSESSYFVGTQNRGLLKWNPKTDQFKSYPFFDQLGVSKNSIYDIAESNGELYLASWGGLIKFDPKRESFNMISNDSIMTTKNLYVVHKLMNKNQLLVGGELGFTWYEPKHDKWKKFKQKSIKQDKWIPRFIHQEKEDEIWICTEGSNLIKLNLNNNEIKTSQRLLNISKNARHVIRDKHTFWIASDNGIIHYNNETDAVLKHITFEKLHPSNVTYSIQIDSTGTIWAGTNFGLVKIINKTHRFILYGLENGLNFLEFNTAATLKDVEKYIYGGVGGLTVFDPYEIQENFFSPTPFVYEIKINNDSIFYPTDKDINLTHKQNFLTFNFTNNNLSNPKNNQFLYRLVGFDDDWVNNYNRHFTTLTGLTPGKYTFELKSINGDGIPSQESNKIHFSILPPWWKTNWFLTISFLILISALVYFIRNRFKSIKKRAQLKDKVFETKMMALRAQMNPHFIFNCLNNIDALILSNNTTQATKYLNKFAKLLRSILDSSNQTSISISKDLDNLKLYTELEEMRSDYKFNTIYDVDQKLLQKPFKVPPMIVQPFVENAIIHGLNNLEIQGLLRIEVTLEDSYIKYVITDNGIGRNLSKSLKVNKRSKRSYGIELSKNRVQHFNKEEHPSVRIEDVIENGKIKGTKVLVRLKI